MKMSVRSVIKSVVTDFFSVLFRIIDQKKSIALIERICVAFNNSRSTFINFTIYPKFARDMDEPLDFGYCNNKVAIVIQGPIIERDFFTLETIRLYKKIYKDCNIVLSSWNNTSRDLINQLEKEDIHIVLSDEPHHSGIGNINYQVKSTLAGVNFAKELGALYVLKTRTDQRLYRKNLIEYLLELENEYPVQSGCNGLAQNRRIIILEGTTAGAPLLIPGYISDFFFFGDIDDISRYFNYSEEEYDQNYCERKEWLKQLRENCNMEDYFKKSAPEVLLYENYLNKRTRRMSDRIEEYWDFLSNYTIGISWNDLGLFWYKYDRFLQTNKLYGNYDVEDTGDRKMTYRNDFINWTLIRNAKVDPSVYRSYCTVSAKLIDP